MTHLNPVIAKLAAGLVATSSIPVPNGEDEIARAYGDSALDSVIFEMEHHGFDFPALRRTLQSMLSRKRIAQDLLSPSVAPFARIPAYANELPDWMIKQALDQGVYGLVIPRLETADEARAVVRAARYPGARSALPTGGIRGYAPAGPARYWGLEDLGYVAKADVWPLNSDGELLIIGIIESIRGVENIEQILDATPGIGAIMPGPGDLYSDLGLLGQWGHPDANAHIERVEKACRDRGVPLAGGTATVEEIPGKIAQGYRIIMSMTPDKAVPDAVAEWNRSLPVPQPD